MWYEKKANAQELDYSKPIFAEDKGLGVMLLLPQLGSGYEVKGYNWFRLKDGHYNSSCNFATPKEAVKSYQHNKIYNGEIEIKHQAQKEV